MSRESCEFFERCGATGHYMVEGSWQRCECFSREVNRRKLGPMFSETPQEKTQLDDLKGEDLVLEGTLNDIRSHLCRVCIGMQQKAEHWVSMDAYTLIDIFLEKDVEYSTAHHAVDAKLLILLLGFADPPNRMLPELVLQVMNRRALHSRATWVVMGIPLDRVITKYGSGVHEYIKEFKRVVIK